jgi:hypothetical protein
LLRDNGSTVDGNCRRKGKPSGRWSGDANNPDGVLVAARSDAPLAGDVLRLERISAAMAGACLLTRGVGNGRAPAGDVDCVGQSAAGTGLSIGPRRWQESSASSRSAKIACTA